MENITANTKITFFNAEFSEDEWGQTYGVFFCCCGIHFRLYTWSHGDYYHGSEGVELVVVGRCDKSCEEAYHKLASLAQIWKESYGGSEDMDEIIGSEQILEDLPIMVENFFGKGVIGESSIKRRFDNFFPEKLVRP